MHLFVLSSLLPLGIHFFHTDSSLQNMVADAGAEVSRDYSSDNESCDVKVEDLRRQHPPTSLVRAGVESWVLVNVVDRRETTG